MWPRETSGRKQMWRENTRVPYLLSFILLKHKDRWSNGRLFCKKKNSCFFPQTCIHAVNKALFACNKLKTKNKPNMKTVTPTNIKLLTKQFHDVEAWGVQFVTMRHATVGYVCSSVCIYTSIKRFQDSLRTCHWSRDSSGEGIQGGCYSVPTNCGFVETRHREVRSLCGISPISNVGD